MIESNDRVEKRWISTATTGKWADEINRYGKAIGYLVTVLMLSWFGLGWVIGAAAKYPTIFCGIIGFTPGVLQGWFFFWFEANSTVTD
ncbi:MAG: hypothetical protein EXS05_24165 [Planctomycetaceae bacterium]|nr:hypothetical protein [Planctomycetaceae bacterium]